MLYVVKHGPTRSTLSTQYPYVVSKDYLSRTASRQFQMTGQQKPPFYTSFPLRSSLYEISSDIWHFLLFQTVGFCIHFERYKQVIKFPKYLSFRND